MENDDEVIFIDFQPQNESVLVHFYFFYYSEEDGPAEPHGPAEPQTEAEYFVALQTTCVQTSTPFDQCAVCLEELCVQAELLQINSCKHVFHKTCVTPWLLQHLSCPLCRCTLQIY